MKTRDITFIAVGIALFVALSMCLRVPVFENYYLCLGYIVMTVYIWCFKWYEGAVIGFFGVILYCVVISGLRGMPGWALGNIVIGAALGLCFKRTKPMKNRTLASAVEIAVIAASVALGILVVKSETESLLYTQPFLVRAAKNSYAFAADVFMLIVSLPICSILDRQAKRMFPELTE